VGVISEATVALAAGIAAEAERIETPCGDGAMVWRCWGGGPPLVLLHGGYGSWMHWIRNVLPLSRQFRVIAPDLPGLGESATPPEPWTAEGLAAIIVAGLDIVLPPSQSGKWVSPHLAGFSFGGVIGGNVAAQLGDRVRGFTVVGSNGLGLERSPTPLKRVAPGAGDAEEFATHRYNLSQLMIADPDKIDELALYLQKTNHARARMRSRRFSRSGALVEALPRITARLDGIWGERDATAYPHVDERARILRSFQPKARFAVVPGAGHWVQYEAADRFNALIAEFAAV
jgi:2-hydroxy-6-oxonona-2,4-dienedioate hydrolase